MNLLLQYQIRANGQGLSGSPPAQFWQMFFNAGTVIVYGSTVGDVFTNNGLQYKEIGKLVNIKSNRSDWALHAQIWYFSRSGKSFAMVGDFKIHYCVLISRELSSTIITSQAKFHAKDNFQGLAQFDHTTVSCIQPFDIQVPLTRQSLHRCVFNPSLWYGSKSVSYLLSFAKYQHLYSVDSNRYLEAFSSSQILDITRAMFSNLAFRLTLPFHCMSK